MNIKDLAKLLDATMVEFSTGNEEITSATAIEDGRAGSVSFIGNLHYERFLETTRATAVIVSETLAASTAKSGAKPALIRVQNPYAAFAIALDLFQPRKNMLPEGIHQLASVHASANVDTSARIGPFVSIGERVSIGARTEVHSGVYIGQDSKIGEDSAIHPNAVVYDSVEIGNRVVIGPGTVLGFDGFGYVPMADGAYRKIPQVGNVVIEDDVEIGANCAIDRATVSETRIKKGAKLDNLIQIAHNVEIGMNTVIAAQTGIAGSAKIGRQNILAGQVGVVGHIETTDGVIIGAQSGISKSLVKSGTYLGSPARNHREALKMEGAMRSLPELIERVKQLEEKLAKS
ncbi:MAG: UDP-3-O-(3-hydroxymyristoyl)glucosamine N-acyltransferase [Candidatus Kapaibacterium sp.]|jgi:UDP-3-O-[3-hydroxymyristoyl] glucosamine N-acyltransferase